MKRFMLGFAAFVAALFSLAAPAAVPLANCYSGSWYAQATTGNGVVIDASERATIAYVYTFNAGAPLWLVAQKPSVDAETFDLYSVHGTHINAPKQSADQIGTVTITPIDANTITFALHSAYGTEFCSGFGPGGPLCNVSRTLVRLTQPVACP